MRKVQLTFGIVLLMFFIASMAYGEKLTPELCKQKAKAAAVLIQAEGEAAFAKIKDPDGEFRFGDGKGYVWIHDLDGVMVMHPINPNLNGKNVLDLRDIHGVFLFAAMNELVEEKGEGWVPYAWSKPGDKKSSPKVSYVVKVENGGNTYVVGSGLYDVTAQDIKAKFPGDAIYED